MKIQVTAPPVDAAANEALLRLLAEALACPRGAVQLVRGNTSRHKQVAVRGLSPADVAEQGDPVGGPANLVVDPRLRADRVRKETRPEL